MPKPKILLSPSARIADNYFTINNVSGGKMSKGFIDSFIKAFAFTFLLFLFISFASENKISVSISHVFYRLVWVFVISFSISIIVGILGVVEESWQTRSDADLKPKTGIVEANTNDSNHFSKKRDRTRIIIFSLLALTVLLLLHMLQIGFFFLPKDWLRHGLRMAFS